MYQAIDRDALASVLTDRAGAPRRYVVRSLRIRTIRRSNRRFQGIRMILRALGRSSRKLDGRPGPDGKLIDRATGETLQLGIRGEPSFQREALIIQNDWQAVGADPFVHSIPAALAGDREQKTLTTGAAFTNGAYQALAGTHHSGRIPTAENRFTGTNSGGYVNPAHDVLMDRLVATIEPEARIQVHRQLMTEFLGNLPAYPLLFGPQTVEAVKGVSGIKGTTTFNMYEWNKQ